MTKSPQAVVYRLCEYYTCNIWTRLSTNLMRLFTAASCGGLPRCACTYLSHAFVYHLSGCIVHANFMNKTVKGPSAVVYREMLARSFLQRLSTTYKNIIHVMYEQDCQTTSYGCLPRHACVQFSSTELYCLVLVVTTYQHISIRSIIRIRNKKNEKEKKNTILTRTTSDYGKRSPQREFLS